ncbi:hypothetical protein [Streptomyces viridochromogenes]|uniref:Secreted protein n=1 Tax=Streptomyces viridochromogenes Tue57 TaxID=1160705 RepID=L8PJZ6_STRVR|nr:hypothetical protein [Streptomyces viridochromogenes]ELS55672.1 hypothetical protein STVIR_3349 [Streptomyces viridochromogenes Tue57]
MDLKRILPMAAASAALVVGAGLTTTASAAEYERFVIDKSFGYTWGGWNHEKVWGYVKDENADGACAQVTIYWYKSDGSIGDVDWTNKACPKDDIEYFEKAAGDGPHWKASKVYISLDKV